jgi:protease I
MAKDFSALFSGGELASRRVGFLVANEGIEQAELTGPWDALSSAGAECELIAPAAGEVQAFNHLDKGDRFPVDRTVADARAEDYDILVLPGGVANPDALRQDGDAVSLVQSFAATGRTLAAICHAPWMLVEAGLARGRTLTSWPSLRTDIENAGGTWVDREVVVDRSVVTSRKPEDIEAFSRAIVDDVLSRAKAA